MARRVHSLLVLVLIGSSWFACSWSADADEIKRRPDAPKPLPPEESIKHFRLPDDLHIELVASEPLVVDPSAMAFDERGRLFVCELHGYNLEGHLDVQELNKTGVLDEVVRRIPAGPEAKEAAEKNTYGTVKMLTDLDGDGRMDRADVWADRLPPSLGILAARHGVIVVGRPDIIYLADRDGDGRAEVREALFSGFGVTLLERSINNPRLGVDNWIYVAGGNAGGRITGPRLKEPVEIGATDFRFKADGTVVEPVTGRNGTFGLTMNDWGDRFLISTGSPALYAVPLPYHYLARNPYVPSPSAVAKAADYDRVYPVSRPHPWRQERSVKKAWAKYYSDRYGVAESIANGYFTAACGQLSYRADGLPQSYRGNHFCCEPAQNMVHRCLIERQGLRFKARRAAGEAQSEFLTSTDQWFRPTNLSIGPDGAIYIVDMYREIIEDYSAIPRYLQQQYGLIEGNDRGRIWRIRSSSSHAGQGPGNRVSSAVDPLPLYKSSTKELVAYLARENAWWRSTAQRLLVERCDKSAVEALVTLAREGKSPQARLHALYTLQGLDALEPAVAERALGDAHFAVRKHALRLCERWLDQVPTLLQTTLERVNDPDPAVRLQLAMTLGETRDKRALAALVQLAARDGDDEWMRAAILSSVRDSSDQLLAAIIRPAAEPGKSRRLLHALASIVGSRHEDVEIGRLLKTIADIGESRDSADPQMIVLTGLVEGLQRGRNQPLASTEGHRALRRLLVARSADVRRLALQVFGLAKLAESPEMKAVFATAAAEALDENGALENRRAATALLASAPYAVLADTGRRLLDARQPLDLQLAAIDALSATDNPEVTSALLAGWTAFTPQVQTAAINAVFCRTNRLPGLLDAIQRGTVPQRSLGALHRVQLLESSDPLIRQRAKSLLEKQDSRENRERFDRYQAALAGPRDATRGESVYEKICSKCHQLKGQGQQVGPELTAANNRPDETILSDILQPSNQIASGFRSYLVIDADGRIFTGVLESESATSITLRNVADGTTSDNPDVLVKRTILRKDIEEMKASEQSLMPDDITKELSPQDAADLIAYLRKALGPAPPVTLTLFEDDSSFVAALTEGGGTATIASDDVFSGESSLSVTPLQRHNPRIPGWQYRITEQPGPGEFRYIRFAWKTHGAGVMFELAADGHWPPANQPIRRYYAGQNTSDWKATKVGDRAPTEWAVVTRDLWSDFGPFTLTGIAPTALGGQARFDRIELLRSLDDDSVSARVPEATGQE